MTRLALACCALLACNGGETPASTPTGAPGTTGATAAGSGATNGSAAGPANGSANGLAAGSDTATPTTTCFAIPFGLEAERAGIRRLAHHAGHATVVDGVPAARGVTVLPVGAATVVPSLQPATTSTPPAPSTPSAPASPPTAAGSASGGEPALTLGVDLGAAALVSMARIDGSKVTLTAPAHLEGAVLEIAGKTRALVAVGPAGLATLARYRTAYVKPRLARTPARGADAISDLSPVALFDEDLDGDGALELVSVSRLTRPDGTSELELGALWQTGELSSAALGNTPGVLYLAPPALSAGKPLVFTLAGDRIRLDGKTLTALTPINANGPRTYAVISGTASAQALAVHPPAPQAPHPLCLSTSATVEAALVAQP